MILFRRRTNIYYAKHGAFTNARVSKFRRTKKSNREVPKTAMQNFKCSVTYEKGRISGKWESTCGSQCTGVMAIEHSLTIAS